MSEIRVRNDTGNDLEVVGVTLAGGGPQLELGPLPPGAASDWQRVDVVPRYPSIEATMAGTDLVHRPYESGQAMPEGRYTYVLRIEADRLVVGLEF